MRECATTYAEGGPLREKQSGNNCEGGNSRSSGIIHA